MVKPTTHYELNSILSTKQQSVTRFQIQ